MTAVPMILDAPSGCPVFDVSTSYTDKTRRILLIVFFLALVLPIQPELAGQRMDPYRFLLLVLFLPFSVAIFRRRAGQITIIDTMMGCYAFWIVVTLVFHHGMVRFAYASVWAIMLLGGYMTGRLLVRSEQDYLRFIRYFLTVLLILLPFAIYEFLTGDMIISRVLELKIPVPIYEFFTGDIIINRELEIKIPTVEKFHDIRLGFSRVQVFLPHSILFGFFCSVCFGNVIYIYRRHFFGRLVRLALVIGMTGMALSSAPLLSIALQSMMAGWDKITRGRWMMLFAGIGSIYVFLSVVSDRGPIILLIDNLTFNPSTAWWRVHIWDYGVQNVMDNPLMGLGLNDWARPDWLADTVDNFWLLTAMQAGLPALAFLVIALVIHVVRIVKVEGLDEQTRDIRTGYLVVLAGTVFTLSTVHVWDAMAVFIMFFIGAGSFLFTSLPEDQKRQAQDIQAIRANCRKIQPEVVRAPVIYTRVHLEQHHTRFVEKAGTRKALSRHIRSGDEVRNPSNS